MEQKRREARAEKRAKHVTAEQLAAAKKRKEEELKAVEAPKVAQPVDEEPKAAPESEESESAEAWSIAFIRVIRVYREFAWRRSQ